MIPSHLFLLVVFVCAAAVIDLRSRRIPNWLALAGTTVGISTSSFIGGSAGALDGLMGFGVGLLVLVPFFALRVLGAGDVKMLAAIGSFAGPGGVLYCALYAMIAGGLLAGIVLLGGGKARLALENIRAMSTTLLVNAKDITAHAAEVGKNSAARLPYAVALAAGALTWIFLHARYQ